MWGTDGKVTDSARSMYSTPLPPSLPFTLLSPHTCGIAQRVKREREGGREGGRGTLYSVCACVRACVWLTTDHTISGIPY